MAALAAWMDPGNPGVRTGFTFLTIQELRNVHMMRQSRKEKKLIGNVCDAETDVIIICSGQSSVY